MGFIRGKIEADREVVQRHITVGNPAFRKCHCGCERYYDVKTGAEVMVTVTTLGDELNRCFVQPAPPERVQEEQGNE